MSNQAQQTQMNMSGGLEETSTKRKKKIQATEEYNEDPILRKESLGEFSIRVEEAKMTGVESIEAEEHVINAILPGGLKGAKHVMYRGILVCPVGTTEQVYKDMETTLEQKLFKTEEVK